MKRAATAPAADLTFPCMGSDVRLVIEGPGAAATAERERGFVEACAAALSRFEPASELSALNRDPRPEVPASRLLRATVAAGIWAAERSGGLVDPTLVGAIERAGYAGSRAGDTPAPLAEALATAPPRRPARPHPAAAWRQVEVGDDVIRRPPGVRLDSGGVGKGLIADAVRHRLAGRAERAAVDCGGDIALLGEWEIDVRHPLTHETVEKLRLEDCGVATSGLDLRVWRTPDGFAHHLLDPETGAPAWTGLVGATAIGDTALEAETLAKLALLSGPEAGRTALAGAAGGILFHEDGRAEVVTPA